MVPAKRPVAIRPTRGHLVLSALLFSLLANPRPVFAETQFDVFLGFAENVAEASWFSATVEVMNDGPPFTGVIEITGAAGRGGQRMLVPVELPTRTLKRVPIPMFNPGGGYYSWNFRLLDGRNRTVAEKLGLRPQRDVPREGRLLGAVVARQSGLPVLPGVSAANGLTAPVARVQPEQLPDNPLALEGLGALYLGAERAPDLKAPQVQALLAWLHTGGHLIVGVEQVSDVNATAWLRDLLPCSLGGVSTIRAEDVFHEWLPNAHIAPAPTPVVVTNNPATGTTTNASGKKRRTTPRPPQPAAIPLPRISADETFATTEMPVAIATVRDGEVLLSAGGLPLVIEARRGRGTITVLTFAAEREPFISWTNRAWFWVKAAGIPESLWTRPNQGRSYGTSFDGIFGAVLDSRQAGKMPVGWLLALLACYLAVIGPGDRWMLKKINRPMLTWITFPLYVVGFSVLVYFIGYALRAGETEWNEMHIVDVIPRSADTAHLRGRTYASLYSAGNRAYALQGEPGAAFNALRAEHAGGGAMAGDAGQIVREGNQFKARVNVPVWTSQLFVNEWTKAARPPLTWSARAITGGTEVRVTNQLDRPLTRVTLVLSNQVFELGDVPAKGEKKFTASGTGTSVSTFVGQFAQSIQLAVNYRNRAFGNNDRPEVEPFEAAFAATCPRDTQVSGTDNWGNNFANLLPQAGLDLTRLRVEGDAVLLAYADKYAPAPPLRQFDARAGRRATVFRLTTPFPGAEP